MNQQTISDRMLLRVNSLENWLERTRSKAILLPARFAGYLALAGLLIASNIFALLRWPFASLLGTMGVDSGAPASLSGRSAEFQPAAGRPVSVDSDQLEELINSGRPVLVDFWAAWCGPCIMMNESLRRLARDLGEECLVVKVDTMKHAAAAKSHGVKGLPSLILFHNGEEVDRHVGALSSSELRSLIDRSIPHETPHQS